MAAVLSTNMASLYAQKNLSTAQASLSASVQRLSSGTRINSAKDDAAGYGISESLKGTKNIVDQSIRNTKDAISQLQTAEGALDVVGKMLQRVLTLTTQRQDGTLNSDQTDSINNEIASLLNEIQNVKERTQFQGGSGSVFGTTNTLTTGTGTVSTIEIANLSLGNAPVSSFTLGTDIQHAGSESDFLYWPNDGGYYFEVQVPSTYPGASSIAEGMQIFVNGADTGGIVDYVSTMTDVNHVTIGYDINSSSSYTANLVIPLQDGDTVSFGTSYDSHSLGLVDNPGAAADGKIDNAAYFDASGNVQSLEASDVANLSTSVVQDAIQINATNRSDLGIWLNRLDYSVDNMQTLSTNLADGISRIVDTDYAAETSNLTRTQILQQAATSMLAQANQMPNVILTLLK